MLVGYLLAGALIGSGWHLDLVKGDTAEIEHIAERGRVAVAAVFHRHRVFAWKNLCA